LVIAGYLQDQKLKIGSRSDGPTYTKSMSASERLTQVIEWLLEKRILRDGQCWLLLLL